MTISDGRPTDRPATPPSRSRAACVIERLEARALLAATPLPRSIGGKDFDGGSAVATAPNGDVIVAGLFRGTIDFDNDAGVRTLTARGDSAVFVARYTAAGSLVWAGQIGGAGGQDQFDTDDLGVAPIRQGRFVNGIGAQPSYADQYVNGIAVAADGTIYLAGTFDRTADFDPTDAGVRELTARKSPSDAKYYDAFVVKLRGSGKLAWARQIGGEFDDVAQAVTAGADGNVYLTGYYTRRADFDPGAGRAVLDATGRGDAFVASLTSGGKYRFAFGIGGDVTREAERDAGAAIATDNAGNVYVAGQFTRKTDFDPSPDRAFELTTGGHTDAFVAKYSSAGTFAWATAAGGEDFDGATALAVDAAGGAVYYGGYFEHAAFFNTAAIGTDAARFRLDATPEPGKKPDDAERTDLFVSRVNAADGRPVWASRVGGDGYELLAGLHASASGVDLVGSFYGRGADFDPGPGKRLLTSRTPHDKFKDDPNDNGREYSYDVFNARLSPNGKYVYADRFGGVGDDFAIGTGAAANGGTIVTGRYRSTFDVGVRKKKLKSRGREDAFVVTVLPDARVE